MEKLKPIEERLRELQNTILIAIKTIDSKNERIDEIESAMQEFVDGANIATINGMSSRGFIISFENKFKKLLEAK